MRGARARRFIAAMIVAVLAVSATQSQAIAKPSKNPKLPAVDLGDPVPGSGQKGPKQDWDPASSHSAPTRAPGKTKHFTVPLAPPPSASPQPPAPAPAPSATESPEPTTTPASPGPSASSPADGASPEPTASGADEAGPTAEPTNSPTSPTPPTRSTGSPSGSGQTSPSPEESSGAPAPSDSTSAASAAPAPAAYALNPSAAPAPTAGSSTAPSAGSPQWTDVPDTGVQIAAGAPEPSAAAAPVSAVEVDVLGVEDARAAGVEGLVVSLSRDDGEAAAAPVQLKVSDDALGDRFGADYASRVTWAQLPDCDPQDAACSPTPLVSERDAAQGATVLSVPAVSGGAATRVAALAGTSSSAGTGDYGATSLSASGSWQVSAQSGDFVWSYPLRVPPAPAGPQPSLALGYSSGSVDGRTGSTNNQPSWVGEGWDMSVGFVERSYASCASDTAGGSPATGDLCWKGQNLTLSLDGHSGELVRDSGTGAWRLRSDDGSRIEQLTGADNGDDDGEHWRLSTPDGTQYYFGLNKLPGWALGNETTQSAWTVPVFGNQAGEPCYNPTFASAWCQQAWRWNLDYVVDAHGNTEAFYYAPETNLYGRNLTPADATSYTRGGTLARIDYAMRAGTELSSPAPARVMFDVADRCVAPGATCTSATPGNWPDVPWDQNCAAGPCTGQHSPSFWSTKRLAAVRTQILTGGVYAPVDQWTLTQTYPDPADGTSASLWLAKIGHTGQVGGTATVPDVEFSGTTKQNRVWMTDGLSPLMRWRLSSIRLETGGIISVNYAQPECAPSNLPANAETNSMRCFPQWWAPPTGPSKLDYFHKYVVTSVTATHVTGGAMAADQTYYDYLGAPAWHYDDSVLTPDDKRTWSGYRGYGSVRIRHGDANAPAKQETTEYTYFRGMNGDRAAPAGGTKSVSIAASDGTSIPDDNWLRGQIREQITYNGYGGPVVAGTIHAPWASGITAADGVREARMVRAGQSTTRTALASGWRTTSASTSYTSYGFAASVNDLGDVSTAADDRCTTTAYAPNTAAWIINLPYRVTTVGVACGATPALPADAIGDTRTYYDGAALGTPPTRGDVTTVEVANDYPGGMPTYLTTAATAYDALGRPVSATDAIGRTSANAYAPATGLLTSVTTTNAVGWTTTSAMRPEWGAEASTTDANGKVTEASFDALGRRVGVWAPDRPRAANPTSPSIEYGYTISTTAPNVVTTGVLNSTGLRLTSYALYDGFLRLRQTQTLSQGGGAVIADTLYDAAGRVEATHAGYYITASPSGTLFEPSSLSVIPARTVHTFDGVGRETQQTLWVLGVAKQVSSIAYYGDHVDTVPPTGATATTVYADARGNITTRMLWHGTLAGGHDDTTYGYTKSGQLASIVDAAGNAWSYSYDALGRQTGASDPDAGISSTTYDDAGRATTSTDARGTTVANVYDALDRVVERREGSATGPLLASWTYDTLAKGQLTSSTSYVGADQYIVGVTGYDDAYRPLGDQVTIPGSAGALAGTYTTANTYNVDGSLKQTVMPAMGGLPAETLKYGYTSLGLPLSLGGPSLVAYVTTAVYTHTGLLAQVNQNTAQTSTTRNLYYEDGTDRLQRVVESSYGTGAGGVVDRGYSYDPAGNVLGISALVASGVTDAQCFGYDYKQQLTRAWTPASGDCAPAPSSTGLGGPAPYWVDYSYDAVGNRVSETRQPVGAGAATTTQYSYPAAGSARPHGVTATATYLGTGATPTSAAAYAYDAAGNATTWGSATLTYDAQGRQATATVGALSSTDRYDADGNRLLHTDPTGTTLYLGGTELKATPSGVSAARTYTFAGLPVAVRTSTAGVSGTVMSWLDSDGQGTATATISSTTGAKARRYFDPYGNPRGAGVSWPVNHGYLDKTTDPLTATAHLGAREYDPGLGRFLSVDPVLDTGNPGHLNGYAYGENSPITKSDPTGLFTQDEILQQAMGEQAGLLAYATDAGAPFDPFAYHDPYTIVSTGPAEGGAAWWARTTGVAAYGGGGTKSAPTVTVPKQRYSDVSCKAMGGDWCKTTITVTASSSWLEPPRTPTNHCGWMSFACTFLGVNQLLNCGSDPTGFAECSEGIATLATLGLGGWAGFAAKAAAKAGVRAGAQGAATSVAKVAYGPAPENAVRVLERVESKGAPLPGYKGGSMYENSNGLLPRGNGVTYREWDVNPNVKGVDRGAERIVTGSDGRAYYTNDHYQSFTQFSGPGR